MALYNITADPTEHNDLSDKLPEVVKKMKNRVQYYMKESVPPLNKPDDPRATEKALEEGIWTPWEDWNFSWGQYFDKRYASQGKP